MQKLLRLIPITFCLLLLLSSCSKNTGNTRYISKDAIGVFSINTANLLKKAGMSALSGSPMFSELIKKNGGDTSKLNFDKMGVDFLSTTYIYALPDQRMSSKVKFIAVISIKDAAQFQAFIKSNFPKARIETKDKLTIATLDANACIGWDKQTAIAAATMPSHQWQEDGREAPVADNATMLIEDVQKTFALTQDQSLAENKKFADLQAAGHDLSFWMNYEAFINAVPQQQIGQAGAVLASQKKLLKDAYIAAGMDFEKGKITGNATYYFNPSVKAVAEALEVKSVNNDLLGKTPGNQLNLIMSYHFNPKGIKTLIDTMNMLPLANVSLQGMGLSLDDILNAFTGDFQIAVTDFSVATESQSYTLAGNAVNYTKPVPSYKASLSFKIKDKAAFDKLLQLAVKEELLTASGPNTYTSGGFVTLSANGEYASFSNDAAVANAFLASSGGSKFNLPAEIKNNPYGFYLDIKNSIQSVPLDLLYGKEDSTVFHEAKNLMESILVYGGKVEGDHSDMHFEARFQNKEENSLLQLIKFKQKVEEAEKKQGDSFDEVVPDDDSTEEPVDTAAAI